MKKSFINPEINITLFDGEKISTTEQTNPSAVPTTNQEQAMNWVKQQAQTKAKETISIISFN